MKDVMVVTPQFHKLWEAANGKSKQSYPSIDALVEWSRVVQRVLWDMGYDAYIEIDIQGRTEVYERVGPDKHKRLGGAIRQHIENAIKTVTLEEALID